MTRSVSAGALLLGLALATATCGGDAPGTEADAPPTNAGAGELSDVELEQGIGPIRDLELGPVDAALAAQGEEIFTTKCSACHKIEERYVAPALGEVLSRRRPEYVMNMMLNANEMVERHPVVRELLAEFYTPMPVQLTDPEQARAVLEYLRSVQSGPSTDTAGAGSS
ncbi:MAG TPA: cytochrome c [Longimicrobiales bacterium]|nr:cytochrome c [Longimicrobiales bacterium]